MKAFLPFWKNCFTLKELHETIQKKTERLFHDLENFIPENTTIFLIKDYISKHYSNEGLSVKEISEQVFLSTSYVCTFFKNETGTDPKSISHRIPDGKSETASCRPTL